MDRALKNDTPPSESSPDAARAQIAFHPRSAPRITACLKRRVGAGLTLAQFFPAIAIAAPLPAVTQAAAIELLLALLLGLVIGYLLAYRPRRRAQTAPEGMTRVSTDMPASVTPYVPPPAPSAEVEVADASFEQGNDVYQDMLESVSEVIFRTDELGRLIYLNGAWLKLSGHTVQGSLGKPLFEFLHPDDRHRARQLFQDLTTGACDACECEFRLRTRGGEIRWIEVTARRARDAGLAEAALVGTVDDISARKVSELTLRNLNQELEARVRLRTAELETSNRELEAFSYSVSHDLRAPLRAIDGFARILEEELEAGDQAQASAHLTRIRKATERMAQLIDALINLALLTRQPLQKETFSLSRIASQIADELHAEEPDRNVSIEITQGLMVTADPALIYAMLDNLLRNAWKFTAEREHARIALKAERIGERRVFCVEDNGAGFDMNHASNLFRAFYRLHSSESFPGTGIGLATVQRIVRRHDGSIWAESRSGEGARFLFTLGQ